MELEDAFPHVPPEGLDTVLAECVLTGKDIPRNVAHTTETSQVALDSVCRTIGPIELCHDSLVLGREGPLVSSDLSLQEIVLNLNILVN